MTDCEIKQESNRPYFPFYCAFIQKKTKAINFETG